MGKILVQFTFSNLEAKVYEGVIRDLKAAGFGNIPERLFHAAAQNGKDWHLTDVWQSEDAFKQFGETMVPLLIKNRGTPVTPLVIPVHNIIIPE